MANETVDRGRWSSGPKAVATATAALSRAQGLARLLVRTARREKRRFLPPELRVVWHESYRIPDNPVVDPKRAERTLAYLVDGGWYHPSTVLKPRPLRYQALGRVHARAYLEELADPDAVGRFCPGIPTQGDFAARILEAQRAATAGTVSATALALRAPARGPVVNLGGGFHHARADKGGGFCLFNDVAIAIEQARAHGFDGRVLVVDLDLHHGDGTRSIYADDERVFTFSIHAAPWTTDPAVAALDVVLGPGVGDATFLGALRDTLGEVLARSQPDLVFYVAGVDPALDDGLGGWRLSAGAILERDRMVLAALGDRPFVMVTAGGYGTEAWRYTARTLAELAGAPDRPIPTRAEVSLERFRWMRARLDRRQLTGEPDVDDDTFGIRASDLYGDLVHKTAEPRLLGFYSKYGVETVLEHYGLADLFRKRGYPNFCVTIEPEAPTGPTLWVHTDDTRRELLMELCVTRQSVGDPLDEGSAPLSLLKIEWLLLQDPRAEATRARPLLPGQEHPGLGGLKIVVGFLIMACERLGVDGLSFVPSQFHVARVARSLATFLNPEDEGRYLRVEELVRGLPVSAASRAIAAGSVEDPDTSEALVWHPATMVIPASQRLRDLLASDDYARVVEAAARGGRPPVRTARTP